VTPSTTDKPLKVAWCLPTLKPSDNGDASFHQQMSIANGMAARGHVVDLIAPADLSGVVARRALGDLTLVKRTCQILRASRGSDGDLAHPAIAACAIPECILQLCLLDACLQCLPGHDIVQERNGLYKAGVAMPASV